jgi:hypothetical protein
VFASSGVLTATLLIPNRSITDARLDQAERATPDPRHAQQGAT